MKFSVFTDMLHIDSFADALHEARQLGFESVDLRAKLDGDTIDSIDMEKARRLKELIDANGLHVNSISSWAINPCTFYGHPKYDNYDERHHRQMTDVFERLCDLADAFGAAYIRIYSLYRAPKFDKLPEAEKDAQYKHNAEMLLRHAEHAQRRGKIALVENEPPTLTKDAKELGILMKHANHPNLKINWDILNEWRAGQYPTVESYAHIMGHVHQTHLKGGAKTPGSETPENPHGTFRNFAIADQDDFDHGPILRAIAVHDPQAVMTIDTHFPNLDDKDQEVGAVEVMRRTKRFLEAFV